MTPGSPLAIPDRTNVYGVMNVPHGLKPVLWAVEHLVSDGGRASIYRSGFDGAETLSLTMDAAGFDSTPLEVDEHLLTGGAGGSLEEVLAFVRTLSRAISEAGIGHRFEVYDDRHQLVQIIPS